MLVIYSIQIFQFVQFIYRINCLLDARASCKTVPNLTREQLELCYRASDVTIAAIEGLELAVHECQHQVRLNWRTSNFCSSCLKLSVSMESMELLIA